MIEYEKSRKRLKEWEHGQYKKKVDKRRIDSFMSKNGESRAEIRRVYENGGRRTWKSRTREKSKIKKVSFDAMEYTTSNGSSSGELNPTPNDTNISISEMF